MRVKSGLWVAAFVRRCYGEGAPAVVMRRGRNAANLTLATASDDDVVRSITGAAASLSA